jgi:hypothetical protein
VDRLCSTLAVVAVESMLEAQREQEVLALVEMGGQYQVALHKLLEAGLQIEVVVEVVEQQQTITVMLATAAQA